MKRTVPHTSLDAACVAEVTEANSFGASVAFEQFAGEALLAGKPVVRRAEDSLEPGVWVAGIFFEMHGEFGGNIAILLSEPTRDAVMAVLENALSGAPSAEARDSIVLELGNVVASQIVSALADRMCGRIVLSIPYMVTDGAERELSWRARHSSARAARVHPSRVDTEFVDASGRLRALVVLVPDPPGEDAHPDEAFDTVEA